MQEEKLNEWKESWRELIPWIRDRDRLIGGRHKMTLRRIESEVNAGIYNTGSWILKMKIAIV